MEFLVEGASMSTEDRGTGTLSMQSARSNCGIYYPPQTHETNVMLPSVISEMGVLSVTDGEDWSVLTRLVTIPVTDENPLPSVHSPSVFSCHSSTKWPFVSGLTDLRSLLTKCPPLLDRLLNIVRMCSTGVTNHNINIGDRNTNSSLLWSNVCIIATMGRNNAAVCFSSMYLNRKDTNSALYFND